MPRLNPTPRFDKALAKIAARDVVLFRQATKALRLFAADVHHPSLNFEKLEGTTFCTIRASRGHRLIVRQGEPDAFDLVDIVDHDTMERRYG